MLKKLVPVVVLAVVACLLYWGAHRADPKPDFYSGVVEATETQLSFQLGGTLEQIAFDEGDTIQKGQPVANLDARDLKAELEGAKAEAKAMAAQLAELEAGSRPQEVAQSQAALEQARAELRLLQNGPTAEQLAQAQHQAEAAHQQWLLALNGPREEDIQAARAALASARSDQSTAEADEVRYRALFKEGAAPESLLEEKVNRLHQSQARVKQAREQLQKLETGTRVEEQRSAKQQYLTAQARYEELQRGTRSEQVDQARARVEGLSAQLALVEEGPRSQTIEATRARPEAAKARVEGLEVKFSKTQLLAPTGGIVVLRNFEPGEMVGPGVPVLKVADLAHPWVTIFVPEPDLATVKLGGACQVTVDSLPGKTFDGKVRFISSAAEYTPRQIQTQAQRVLLVFRAEVDVDNPELLLKPGMPADVKVLR